MDKKVYFIWLSLALGPQSRAVTPLMQKYADAEEIYKEEDFSFLKHITENTKQRLNNKNLEKALEIYGICAKKKIGLLCYNDINYPERLKTISEPPVLLYYLGRLPDFNGECFISVVGTRNNTDAGGKMTEYFASAFASSGAIVVSGMASGIDGFSHKGALKAGGFTVAVLGTAIDKPYPRENEPLYYDIAEKGLVLSEYCPGYPGSAYNFPMRNRIIAGISFATLITEAGERSGALITAKCAISQGREVYALPGIAGSEQSVGTSMLLQKGVRLAYRPFDILSKAELLYPDKINVSKESYSVEIKQKTEISVTQTDYDTVKYDSPSPRIDGLGELEPNEIMILKNINGDDGSYMDDIITQTGLDAGTVMSTLTVLEVYGVVKQRENGKYIILNNK